MLWHRFPTGESVAPVSNRRFRGTGLQPAILWHRFPTGEPVGPVSNRSSSTTAKPTRRIIIDLLPRNAARRVNDRQPILRVVEKPLGPRRGRAKQGREQLVVRLVDVVVAVQVAVDFAVSNRTACESQLTRRNSRSRRRRRRALAADGLTRGAWTTQPWQTGRVAARRRSAENEVLRRQLRRACGRAEATGGWRAAGRRPAELAIRIAGFNGWHPPVAGVPPATPADISRRTGLRSTFAGARQGHLWLDF